MLYLITGVPGAGKTSFTLDEFLKKVFALILSTLLACFVIMIFIVSVKAFGTKGAG